MILNINVGLLGHVDSGKTTLAKSLSSTSSTAAFDKNPQSLERGITLDLGFSATLIDVPTHIKELNPQIENVQFTFVDCPGHASLIKTIIGGAQIIDVMLLVIDAKKGVQTQTAECLVIGEILQRKLIVVINKIDLIDIEIRNTFLEKLNKNLRRVFAKTTFGENVSICYVSAQYKFGIEDVVNQLKLNISVPNRQKEKPLIMYVDHCFSIKGQGTICTGTIVQGTLAVNDNVELPSIAQICKIKSLQIFHKPVRIAITGDRVGACLNNFNAKRMERGVLCQTGLLKPTHAAVIQIKCIKYYKFGIKSKSKFHISAGHDTVMTQIILFRSLKKQEKFKNDEEYEYVDELQPELQSNNEENVYYALLDFEKCIFLTSDTIVVGSKLDIATHENHCRLAFWGTVQWYTTSPNFHKEHLSSWKIFRKMKKQGHIQRVINEREIIVQNLFKVQTDRQLYVGKQVMLSTGEEGYIATSFGQTAKVKVILHDKIKQNTWDMLKDNRSNEILVTLNFKKYIFNKNYALSQ